MQENILRAEENMKNEGKVDGIPHNRRWHDFCASKTNMIRALPNILLTSLFFLLFCLGFAEARVPEAHRTCALCHVEEGSPALKASVNKTCIDCHPNSPTRDHPIGRVVQDAPEKLPLDEENRITCITCHEPHGKGTEEQLLRMDFNSLCVVCHKK